MTDNDIIKALQGCVKAETWGDYEKTRLLHCPASAKSFYLRTSDDNGNALHTLYIEILKDTIDFINHQQTEIERLKCAINKIKDLVKGLRIGFDNEMEYVFDETLEKINEISEGVEEPYKK